MEEFDWWNEFKLSGKINDYIAYKIYSSDNLATKGEQGNADYDRGSNNS